MKNYNINLEEAINEIKDKKYVMSSSLRAYVGVLFFTIFIGSTI